MFTLGKFSCVFMLGARSCTYLLRKVMYSSEQRTTQNRHTFRQRQNVLRKEILKDIVEAEIRDLKWKIWN